MTCSHCPVVEGECLGRRAARLCELAATRGDYRLLLVERAGALAAGGPRAATPQGFLAAVSACPSRGPVLPHRLQPECGCAELTECRAGRGVAPGRVTLRDCLACTATRPAASPPPPG